MGNYQVAFQSHGREVMTLEDILPEEPGLKLLFIAKVPTPDSVAAGHYFQGNHGKMLWNKLKNYGVLNVPRGEKEDEHLLRHGYGMIDIVKGPRNFGKEPRLQEYMEGIPRLFNILEMHKPKLIIFVYKKVLDKILYWRFRINDKSKYGFNEAYESLFGCSVFVFPMPGTPCERNDADRHMKKLANYVFNIN